MLKAEYLLLALTEINSSFCKTFNYWHSDPALRWRRLWCCAVNPQGTWVLSSGRMCSRTRRALSGVASSFCLFAQLVTITAGCILAGLVALRWLPSSLYRICSLSLVPESGRRSGNCSDLNKMHRGLRRSWLNHDECTKHFSAALWFNMLVFAPAVNYLSMGVTGKPALFQCPNSAKFHRCVSSVWIHKVPILGVSGRSLFYHLEEVRGRGKIYNYILYNYCKITLTHKTLFFSGVNTF